MILRKQCSKQLAAFLILFSSIAMAVASGKGTEAGASDIRLDLEWAGFISKHDLTWHRVPGTWEASPFLGNGWMGMMIYENATNAHELRIDAQHAGVNDHRSAKTGGGPYNQARLPIGHFIIRTAGEIRDCDWRLDLWNAELAGTLRTTAGEIYLRALVHSDDMVALVELRYGAGEMASVEFCPDQAISPRSDPIWKRTPPSTAQYPPNPAPDMFLRHGLNICRQLLLAGGEYATAWAIETNGVSQRLRFGIAQSFPETNAVSEAVANVQRAAAVPVETWVARHRQWWHEFYPRSFVSMADPYWESFYWIQRYKMGSATRADRCLIDNHGPWLEATPWPYATWNLNVQLTYWPFNAAGLLDLASSLPNHLRACASALQNTVPDEYRADSAAIGRAVTESLEEHIDVPGKNAEVGNLTWALHDVWLQYRHSMDDALLRDPLFPLLRRSINYYRHFLTNGVDGRLHLPATFSPEYGSAPDCNYDLSLIRWGCQTLLWSNHRLKLNDPLVPEWRKILDQLTPYPGDGTNGFFIGAGVPFAESHRHYAHLLMIYPLYLVNVDQLGGRDQIERSVAHWQSLPKGLVGYSMTGAASLYAALGDGDRALQKLDGLRRFISPTTMYRESGPCIETPLSGAQAIHDLLVQNWGDTIRIFPALPKAWKQASFHELRTEGAFLVSAAFADGQTQWVRVKSLAGEPFKLRPNQAGQVRISGSGASEVQKLEPGLYSLNLAKGREVFFLAGSCSTALIKTSLDSPHHFGLP